MVLLCSTWCGPTWQSGEWISLVAPNSHRWRRKKKITTVRPGCYCHAMSEHIGCSISNLECRLDLLVEALGSHNVNGIGLQSGSPTKTLMSHCPRRNEPDLQDLRFCHLCLPLAVPASELCSSKGEWCDLVRLRFGLKFRSAQLVDSIGTQKVSSVTRAFSGRTAPA